MNKDKYQSIKQLLFEWESSLYEGQEYICVSCRRLVVYHNCLIFAPDKYNNCTVEWLQYSKIA